MQDFESILHREKVPIPDHTHYGEARLHRALPDEVIRELSNIGALELGAATALVGLFMYGIYKHGKRTDAKEQLTLPILHEP
jgi:hypothetical protein